MPSRWRRIAVPAASLGGFLAVWQWCAHGYPPEEFPSFPGVISAVAELWNDGVLREHASVSLARFACGYLLAVLSGVPAGLLLARVPVLQRAFEPLVQLLRPISPIAWFPLAVLWFGIGSAPAVFIIFLAAFFPVLLSTVAAVQNVPDVYLKVAANFGAGKGMVFLRVIVPAAFPGIMVGLHIAVGTAWIHLVAGEMLGAQSGLGFMIVDARNFLRTDRILAGMLLVGLLGWGVYRGMKAAERSIGRRWGAVP